MSDPNLLCHNCKAELQLFHFFTDIEGRKECGSCHISWCQDPNCLSRIADGDVPLLMKTIRADNAARGFEAAGRELFCEKMLLVVSEISEALEEFRKGHGLKETYFVSGKPEGIPTEIADACIRLFDFCAANEIDLTAAIKSKLEYNRTRPFKHGRLL